MSGRKTIFFCTDCKRVFSSHEPLRKHKEQRICLDWVTNLCQCKHEHKILDVTFDSIQQRSEFIKGRELDAEFNIAIVNTKNESKKSDSRQYWFCTRAAADNCSARFVLFQYPVLVKDDEGNKAAVKMAYILRGCERHSHVRDPKQMKVSAKSKELIMKCLMQGLSPTVIVNNLFNDVPAAKATSRVPNMQDLRNLMRKYGFSFDGKVPDKMPTIVFDGTTPASMLKRKADDDDVVMMSPSKKRLTDNPPNRLNQRTDRRDSDEAEVPRPTSINTTSPWNRTSTTWTPPSQKRLPLSAEEFDKQRYAKLESEYYLAIKSSVHYSDQNAAMYWTLRMLNTGVLPPSIVAERLVQISHEEIGLADPQAVTVAASTLQLVNQLQTEVLTRGVLGQFAVYLARAPKSTVVAEAVKRASQEIDQQGSRQPPAPSHIAKPKKPAIKVRKLPNGETISVARTTSFLPRTLAGRSFFVPQPSLEESIQKNIPKTADLIRKNSDRAFVVSSDPNVARRKRVLVRKATGDVGGTTITLPQPQGITLPIGTPMVPLPKQPLPKETLGIGGK